MITNESGRNGYSKKWIKNEVCRQIKEILLNLKKRHLWLIAGTLILNLEFEKKINFEDTLDICEFNNTAKTVWKVAKYNLNGLIDWFWVTAQIYRAGTTQRLSNQKLRSSATENLDQTSSLLYLLRRRPQKR